MNIDLQRINPYGHTASSTPFKNRGVWTDNGHCIFRRIIDITNQSSIICSIYIVILNTIQSIICIDFYITVFNNQIPSLIGFDSIFNRRAYVFNYPGINIRYCIIDTFICPVTIECKSDKGSY